ncbi:MAG: outer membrane protein assembly factor BamC [Succinivibrionaceae bacterium]
MRILSKFCLNCCILGSSLILSACTGVINTELREANNDFRYLDEVYNEREIVQPEGTDPIYFSDTYSLGIKPIVDSKAALVGKFVDVRPPQKIISLDPSFITFQDGDLAQIWFYPDEKRNIVTANDMLIAILSFCNSSNILIDDVDALASTIQTSWIDVTEYGTEYNLNNFNNGSILYRQRYLLRLIKNDEGVPGVAIQITDNVMEKTDGTELPDGLNRFEPSRMTAQFANRLLADIYKKRLALTMVDFNYETVDIEYARDNNNLPCWKINAPFDQTYKILEKLFLDYDIEIKSYSSTAGEIEIDYDEFDSEFWEAHQTETWALDSGVYLFKLGVHDGKTTITLYDRNKVAVPSGVVSRMFAGFALSLKREFFIHKNDIGFTD